MMTTTARRPMMGDREWTKAQLEAINANEGEYLVSAGAGSGKTAVLTERIKRLVVEKNVPVSSLLVLTFTNKAAREMKQRVQKAFIKEGRFSLSDECESADITTFDSFNLKLVKKYHYELGISGDIGIIDESECTLLKNRLFDEIIDEKAKAGDVSLINLFKHYALKDDDAIRSMVMDILDKADLVDDRKAFLSSDERYFSKAFIDERFDKLYQHAHERLIFLSSIVSSYENPDLADIDSMFIEPLVNAKDYDSLSALLASSSYPTLKRGTKDNPNSDHDKAFHKALAGYFKGIKSLVSESRSDGEKKITDTKPYADEFLSLARELDSRLAEFERKYGVYTFGDIAAFARKCTENPDIQKELKKQYSYVMVDEFQDTSDLQIALLSNISNGNFFAVGDIKQCIYAFRNANPALFLSFLERYRKGEGHLIILKDNFRSTEEVIGDINSLFKSIMSKELGGVTYDESQELAYGNAKLYSSVQLDAGHLETLSYVKDEDMNQAECEAKIIAADISKKLSDHFQVVASEGVLRDAKPSDFAILISRKSNFNVFQKELGAAKIPVSATETKDLSSEDISRLLLSFLRLSKAIDVDEVGMKHCYMSIMRSYLYEKDDETIYKDIVSGAYKDSELFRKIRDDKAKLFHGSCYEGVSYFLDNFPFVERLYALGNLKDNFEKISSFLSEGKKEDKLGKSYEEFIEHFSLLKHYDESLKIPSPSDDGNSVHLMSIHASKGLQFGIVYCPDLDQKPKKGKEAALSLDLKNGFLIPRTYGDGNPYSALHVLSSLENDEKTISEKARLYYVCLTRAEEKLILVKREKPGVNYSNLPGSKVLSSKETIDKDGKEGLTMSIHSPSSFFEFNLLASGFDFEEKGTQVVDPPVYVAGTESKKLIEAPELKKISILPKDNPFERASKLDVGLADEGALYRGNLLHHYLEVTDLKSKDVSFISSEKDREIIAKVLSLPIFQNLGNASTFKEEAFYDEDKSIHGVIDLLIVRDDSCEVIDYKSKDIDDPSYKKQLGIYKSYVEKVYKRNCRTYLLSILDATIKEVE